MSNKGREVNKKYATDKPAVFTACASMTYLRSAPFSSLAANCQTIHCFHCEMPDLMFIDTQRRDLHTHL